MHLAVIVLLRNEADIFPALAHHLAGLFDTALFLDHGSTDGTTGLIERTCAGRPGWARWEVTVPGNHQARFSTFALRHVFATTQADAVFLLDADEFIDMPGRAALEAALDTVRDARCVPMLAWRNAVPIDPTEHTLCAGEWLLAAPAPSAFEKVVVPRRLFDATGGRLTVSAGNHVIDPGDGVPLTRQAIGTLLHVPLRSAEQVRRKIVTRALAHLARTDRLGHEGAHVFEGLARIAAGAVGDEDVYGWAACYGEPDGSGRRASIEALRRAGFTDRRLPGAAGDAVPALTGASPWIEMAAILIGWRSAATASLELTLSGNRLSATQQPVAAGSDAAEEALRVMRASTSWRLTAPLRALGRKARRLRGKKVGGDVPSPPNPPSHLKR